MRFTKSCAPFIAAIALCLGAAPTAVFGKDKATDRYVVRMADRPVVAYEGGVPGKAATKPPKGTKIDPNDPNVASYAAHLDRKHDEALRKVGGKKVYGYRYSFNGFAADLTEGQAEALRSAPGVLSISKDEILFPDTSSTPTFLGLDAKKGLWDKLGGVGKAGEDIVIGIVDSGIWPEHPSFADNKGKKGTKNSDYKKLKGWHGVCQSGEEFASSDCNDKLIGARYYNAGFGGDDGIDAQFPFEFNSPRDWGGHGSHTASTAGGNSDVAATGEAAPFGSISGIAPRARIAVYKVCWADQPTGGGCATSDSVAAIDQAVADGVDVINFSISGTRTNFLSAVEIAFMYAADAGVFVAASAGNEGQTIGDPSVAHPSPWLTTVAAGTHNRTGQGSTTLGNGATYAGASFATPVASTPLVDAAGAALGTTAPEVLAAELCAPGALDSTKVAGKIVLCRRGTYALVDKSAAVADAGGVGMLLYNPSANNQLALIHSVPTVHLDHVNGPLIKTYIAAQGAAATASIAQAAIVYDVPAPTTASFSSRGPLLAGGGDLLKPDLIAPGQDILAAVAPPDNRERLFDLYSGTSMSSPHVAGLAALLKNEHKDWSPMMIKSALMTTGYDVLGGPNTSPAVIFRQGAGHVAPNSAVDPGLVFDAGIVDWLGFLCGTQLPSAYCTTSVPPIPVLAPTNLNVPSIAIGSFIGSQTVQRTVTSVGKGKETYTASYIGLAGIDVALPAPFALDEGDSKTFAVTFTHATAAFGTYVGGYLVLTGNKGHVVRIPVVLRPVTFSAPTQVSGSYDVKFGYTGSFSAEGRGLVPAVTFDGTVLQGDSEVFEVVVPAGTTYARFSLFDANTTPGSDLDLYVFNSAFNQIGASGGPTAEEEVNFVDLAAGTYYLLVDGFSAPAGGATFTLFTWALGSADEGNMTVVAPGAAVAGTTGTISLTFNGLLPETKYLGSVVYTGSVTLPSPTIVRVDTP
jgi:hypothetical protein